jgi:hypothetical protein
VAARVGAHEVAPGADDPARVAAELLHVGERHPVAVGAQRLLQDLRAPARDRDEHGRVGLDAVPHERDGSCEELLVTPVEERLVAVARRVDVAHSRS